MAYGPCYTSFATQTHTGPDRDTQSQFTQCATFGLARGPLRSPFEPPFKSPHAAPARAVERERTRQIARVGNNLNQIARWAHTHRDEDLAAVEVLAHLVAIERELAALRVRGAGDAA